jgi:hypothetical protein
MITDQRGPGFPRLVDGTVDIGAFEVQSTPPPMTVPEPSSLLGLVVIAAVTLSSRLRQRRLCSKSVENGLEWKTLNFCHGNDLSNR